MKKQNKILIDGKCHILVADNSDKCSCSSCSLKDNEWCTNHGCFCYDIMNASHHHFELEEKLNKKKLMIRNAKSTWWTVKSLLINNMREKRLKEVLKNQTMADNILIIIIVFAMVLVLFLNP